MQAELKHAGQQGFTLVEILVTLVIMGLVAMAVGSFYISSSKQANTQLEVVDVQANLRLVMDRMAKDIQRAGFMTGADPINSDLSTDTTLAINSTAVTGKYARITSTGTGGGNGVSVSFTVGDVQMLGLFNNNDKVRIIRPPLHEEPAAGIYTISSVDSGSISVASIPTDVVINPGDILVGTRDGAPLVSSIVYSWDGARGLIRSVNGADQVLGRNITGVDFKYDRNSDDKIRTVEITLTGTTDPSQTGQAGYSGLKTRTLVNHVTVRNL